MDFYQNKRDLRNFVSRIYRGAFTNLGRRGIVRQKFPFFGLFLILCCLNLFGPQDLARSGDGSLFSKKNRKLAASSPQVVEAPGPYDFTPVTENPVPVTHESTITGTVVDDNDAVVVGATVKAVNPDNPLEFFETTTDSTGKYILPVNFKSFAWETLQKFDLDITRDGFTTKQKLVDVIANRTAGAGKSVLKILDSVITRIGSEGGTHINSLGDLKVIIPPGALSGAKDIRTTLYNKSKQLPAPLPETSFYTYSGLLTADGGDIEFNQPVTIQIANSLGFAPGTKIPIGYYKEDTRQWEDSGQMSTVSADGLWVEFQTTHFSTPDCNFPPPPPSPTNQGPTGSNDGPVEDHTSNNDDQDDMACSINASKINLRSGNLNQEFPLPSMKAMNQNITLEMVYNSVTAKPSVLLATQTDLDSRYTSQPETQSVTFEIEGVGASATFQNTWGKNAERFMWDGKNGQGELVSTGSYPYTITLSNDYIGTYYTADSFGGPPINDTGVETREPIPSTTVVTGRAMVNNQIDSSLGAGWNLASLKRLYSDPDGRILLVEGDGSSRVFDTPHQDIVAIGGYNYDISVLLGKGDGSFQPEKLSVPGDGYSSWSVAVGDFNEDGDKDLVMPNYSTPDVSIFLGSGNGNFRLEQQFGVGYYPFGVAVGDFNEDRHDDLAVTNSDSHDVSVLLGVGDGNFQPEMRFKVDYTPSAIAIGDFNKDNNQDLVTANWSGNNVSILLGKGDGNFESEKRFGVGDFPRSVAIGDFNEDQREDLVTANQYGGDVSVLLGKGDGNFWPEMRVRVGLTPTCVAVGDFNKDGYEDLVTANLYGDDVSVLLGKGDGNFQPEKRVGVGQGPWTVAVGDLNEDKYEDLVTANGSSDDVSVLLGNGDGNFQAHEDFTLLEGAAFVAIGNFNANPEIKEYVDYESPAGDYSKLKKNLGGTYTLTEKDGMAYHFNNKGLLTSEVDRNGNAISYTYNADDQLEMITYPGSAAYIFAYDPSTKKLKSITDSANRTTQFVVNAAGDLEQIINPDGTSRTYTYNAEHLMLTKTDENVNTTDYAYDLYGRIRATVAPERDVWNGNKIVREREITRYFPSDVKGLINDLQGNVGTAENPAPIVDPTTLTDEISGPCGCNAVKGYTNKFGSWTQTEDQLGRVTKYTRDADNNVTKIEYPNYRDTEMTYDTKGNLLTVEEKFNDAVTTFTYEPNFNQIKTITDPLLNVTTFEYDLKGNLFQIKDDNGTITEMTYYNNGLLKTTTQAKGIPELENTTRFTYDPITGNLLTTTDPLTYPTTLTYDPAGNLKTMKDAEDKTTTYTYDLSNNRLNIVEDHLKNITEYRYDNVGNLRYVKDGKTHTTEFTYNEINLLSSIINPLGQTKQFTYDAERLLGRILDAKGQMIQFEYDVAHQLKYKYLPRETVSYGYDDLGGNLISVKNSDSNISFWYDYFNLLTSAKTLSGYLQPATTINYTYDKNNNRLTIKNPQAVTFKYFYDNLNRLTDIKDSAQSTTFAHYVYDALSRRTNLTYPNLTSTTYAHDLASQLTSLKNLLPNLTPFSSFDYIYNKVGFRKTMTTPAGSHQFTYDDIYQLTGADHPDSPDENFVYDPVGNRLTASLSPRGRGLGEGVWVYNAANQLLDDGTYTYTYDDNGNMMTKTEKANPNRVIRYTYNSENQLIQISAPGAGTVKYAYDGLGRRIQKDINNVKTKYVYDNEDIVAEYDGSNVLQATYLHGPGIDEPIRMTRGGQDYYYHADGFGSITELTNSSGTVVQTYKYDAFGNIVAQTGTLVNPFTYAAREFDSESGLYFYRARYYDPKIGRFLQEDPIGMAGGINYYSYASNNPVNYNDPYGLLTQKECDDLAVLGYSLCAEIVDPLDRLACEEDVGTAWEKCIANACDPGNPTPPPTFPRSPSFIPPLFIPVICSQMPWLDICDDTPIN